MKRNSGPMLLRDLRREIARTAGRFISITVIVALGVAFFVGLRATGPDMRQSADGYFDRQQMMDLELLSTLGFTQEDVQALQAQTGVEQVQPGYQLDALVVQDTAETVVKLYSIPPQGEQMLSRPSLVEGTWPQGEDECLIDTRLCQRAGLAVGDTLTLDEGRTTQDDQQDEPHLGRQTFRIAGTVDSPLFIDLERGTSTLGNGQADAFIYLPQSAFESEVYTQVQLTVSGASGLNSFLQPYWDVVDPVAQQLETLGESRAAQRLSDVRGQAQEKLSDAQEALDNARQERDAALEAAQAELDEGAQAIAQGEAEYAHSQAELAEKLAAGTQALDQAQAEIDAGRLELERQEQALEQQAALLDGQQADFEEREMEYQARKAQLEQGQAAFEAQRPQLEALQKQVADFDALAAQIAAYPTPGDETYALLVARYEALKPAVEALRPKLEAAQKTQQALEALDAQLAQAATELEQGRAALSAGRTALSDARGELDAAKARLQQGLWALENQRAALETGRREGDQALSLARARLDEAQAAYDKGLTEFEAQKAETQGQLDEAQAQIDTAQQQLDEVTSCRWYVLDRRDNAGFSGYDEDAARVTAVADVFPVLFFLVAALVSLTTMTRMVEEQRTHIGVLKALGYRPWAVAFKYVAYALLSTLLGCALGMMAGFWGLPRVISSVYAILYTVPPVQTPFIPSYAIGATLLAVACTALSAFAACAATLREAPSQLLRPRAPKAGRRVILERIGWFWRRLSFIRKVTARNLLRYQRRFWMTVLGIAGCMALLLTGFGLRDSIMSIVPRQFEGISHYQLMVSVDPDAAAGDLKAVAAALKGPDGAASTLMVSMQNMQATGPNGGGSNDAIVVALEEGETLGDYISLHPRASEEETVVTGGEAVITEKLASLLGIGVGDALTLKAPGNGEEPVSVVVGAIVENYVYHYVYLTQEGYAAAFGKAAQPNTYLCRLEGEDAARDDALAQKLTANAAVRQVRFTTKGLEDINQMLSSINYVVYVIIIAAGALAFVVLYNLANINITERTRELATIKVLGFYDGEVTAYVCRENALLTVLGILLGLVGGYFLHQYVVVTCEVDMVMFGREIAPMSYLYAAGMTALFAALVNLVLHRKLQKIDMIEALKSVE
ncbi:outer membrane-specific lipoprotein transporter subunit LolE [uncultured Clostridium sp.]|nr:outer membrane-specific lipoprotein transporter subunit LolE [uncultured Clostridium sp.]